MTLGEGIAFGIFVAECVAVIAFGLGAAIAAARSRGRSPLQTGQTQAPGTAVPVHTLNDGDLLDISCRSNEAIVANIDALNNGAVGLLALPAALLVIAVERIRDFPWLTQAVLFALLGISVALGIVAYEYGYWISPFLVRGRRGRRVRVQDSIDTRRFLILYGRFGATAVADAVSQVSQTARDNGTIREGKRTLARLSLICFFLAAGFLIWARGWGPVLDDVSGGAPAPTPAGPCRNVVK